MLRANSGNTAAICVGNSDAKNTGYILAAGERTPLLQVDNLNKLFVVATDGEQGYSWSRAEGGNMDIDKESLGGTLMHGHQTVGTARRQLVEGKYEVLKGVLMRAPGSGDPTPNTAPIWVGGKKRDCGLQCDRRDAFASGRVHVPARGRSRPNFG